ncbi:MAG: efflux RND transporter periplasmic adaptor subunit [Verrucomicrobiae bacterium]|nr:efflux RND transporter periplasmic adaptor subunit [Verrucomicrobiae bacterium]
MNLNSIPELQESQPRAHSFSRYGQTAILVAGVCLAALLSILPGCNHSGEPHATYNPEPTTNNQQPTSDNQQPIIYSCPMHPQIRQPNPGRCPICGMELTPVAGDRDADDSSAPVLRVSRRAAALMEIQTTPAERRSVEAERRFLGRFVYDETRLTDIAVRTDGQVERLFVNYTGVPVRKGEHVAEIYSPEFFAATKELLVAARADADPALRESARLRLRLLDVPDEQIEDMLRVGEAKKTFTLFSPVNGVLTELGGRQGGWLMKGQRLAQIADLSSLWVLLDAYESDIALIHYGQQVKLEVPAFPGREFTGFVAYVAPDLDERTRTIKVRLNVPNPDGRLRPGMFARAELKVPLTADGLAYGPELAGKWICPMHPEITAAEPGACSLCDMPLEAAEKLGHVSSEREVKLPLVIPASAPLITGRRAVVYVQLPNTERPTFEGRNIQLGPRAGDYYLVLEGISEGERVVTEGNFKIDSELQIRGRPSMMAADGAWRVAGARDEGRGAREGFVARTDVPSAFGEQVAQLAKAYLELATALAGDDFERSRTAAVAMNELLHSFDSSALAEEASIAWKLLETELHKPLHAMREPTDIAALREQLVPLTQHTEHAVVAFGAGQVGKLYVAHCPMAFGNKGANWLQADENIANPYYGARMFRCGEIERTLE